MFERCLYLLDTEEIFSLLFVTLILAGVGQKLVEGQPWAARWSGRAGIVALAAYLIRVVYFDGAYGATELLVGLFRALFAGGLALGASAIALALVAGVYRAVSELCELPPSLWRRWTWRLRRRAIVSAPAPAPISAPPPVVPDPSRQAARRRRADARFRCELAYSLHAAKLAARLSRERFDQLVAKYLDDDSLTPDEIDARAEQILRLVRDLESTGDPTRKYSSLAELILQREAQKQQIRDLGLDDLTTDTLLLDIDVKFDELSRRFIRGH